MSHKPSPIAGLESFKGFSRLIDEYTGQQTNAKVKGVRYLTFALKKNPEPLSLIEIDLLRLAAKVDAA